MLILPTSLFEGFKFTGLLTDPQMILQVNFKKRLNDYDLVLIKN